MAGGALCRRTLRVEIGNSSNYIFGLLAVTTGVKRPYFLNLLQIRYPVGAVCSIGHRVSGVVIALCTPFAVYLLGLSLSDLQGYADAGRLVGLLPVKMALVFFAWALAHHALAGVRHLLMDIDVGSALAAARRSAWLVNAGAVAIAVAALGVVL